MITFVVERYWPGLSLEGAEGFMARETAIAEELRREGRPVRIVRSTLVEVDETLLSIVEAHAEADVVELGERTGRAADRIAAAHDLPLSGGGSGQP